MPEHIVNGIQTPLWEWWIVWYFFLGGIAGGAYFTATVVELVGDEADRPIARTGYYIAFPLILLCAICLIFDLGMPQRFWHMMVYRKTLLPWPNWDSAISVGSYAVGVFGLFSFLSFLDALVETGRLPWAPLREKYSGIPRRIYSVLGAIAGFFLASYTGVLLSTTHIPAWADTPLLGALFAASALSTGVATIALILAWRGYDVAASWAKLKRTDNWALTIEIILLVAFLVMASGVAGQLMSGVSLILLGLIVLFGLLTPLLLQLRTGHAHAPTRSTLFTSLLILIGGFILRTVIVMGGQGFM